MADFQPLNNNQRRNTIRPKPGQDIHKRTPTQLPRVGSTLGSYNSGYSTYRPNPVIQTKTLPNAVPQTSPSKTPILSQAKRFVTLKRIMVSLLVLVIVLVGWVGGKFIYNAHKVFGGSIFSILTSSTLNGESSGRVNILLAGNSSDDVGHQGAQLTDSILILSVNTKNDSAFMLSIPRDLWVNIPGNGYQKINDAYVAGQQNNFNENGYFPGGMGLLQQVVEKDFGLHLNYYALIDYEALKDAVDTVGGISVNIQSSDPRGIYDPSKDYATHGPLVRLSNGLHQLDGEQALDLARARGDAYGSYGFENSDFDRTQHQRQMLAALKVKAVSAGVLSNPAKLSSLADAIGNNVTTDFTLSDIHSLYNIVKPINSSNIKSLNLDDANSNDLVEPYVSDNGQDALIPSAGKNDFSAIQAYVNQQISTNPVTQEAASVVILNATNTFGLAAKEKTALTTKGLNIDAIGNALSNQSTTTIIDNSGGTKPATRSLLVKMYGAHVSTQNPYQSSYQEDFIVILGADIASKDPGNGT